MTAVWKLDRAAEMRAAMSPPERIVWDKRSSVGARIARQKVLLGYIADFYLPSCRAIVEIDGKTHDEQRDYDRHRDDVFLEARYSVLRIEAAVVFRSPEVAMDVIRDFSVVARDRRADRKAPVLGWAEAIGRSVRAGTDIVAHYFGDEVETWHAESDCGPEFPCHPSLWPE